MAIPGSLDIAWIGSLYLRDVGEEENTLMRKRASAPGW